jgi:hypothetical protein
VLHSVYTLAAEVNDMIAKGHAATVATPAMRIRGVQWAVMAAADTTRIQLAARVRQAITADTTSRVLIWNSFT